MPAPAAGPTSASPPAGPAAACNGRDHDRDLVDHRRPTRAVQIIQRRDPAGLVPVPPPITVGRDTPTRRAISAFGSPSAASSTIRARCANPASTVEDRTNALSRDSSPSRSTKRRQQPTCLIVPKSHRKDIYDTRH